MEVKVKCRNCGRITIMDYGSYLNNEFICYCGYKIGEIVK